MSSTLASKCLCSWEWPQTLSPPPRRRDDRQEPPRPLSVFLFWCPQQATLFGHGSWSGGLPVRGSFISLHSLPSSCWNVDQLSLVLFNWKQTDRNRKQKQKTETKPNKNKQKTNAPLKTNNSPISISVLVVNSSFGVSEHATASTLGSGGKKREKGSKGEREKEKDPWLKS